MGRFYSRSLRWRPLFSHRARRACDRRLYRHGRQYRHGDQRREPGSPAASRLDDQDDDALHGVRSPRAGTCYAAEHIPGAWPWRRPRNRPSSTSSLEKRIPRRRYNSGNDDEFVQRRRGRDGGGPGRLGGPVCAIDDPQGAPAGHDQYEFPQRQRGLPDPGQISTARDIADPGPRPDPPVSAILPLFFGAGVYL